MAIEKTYLLGKNITLGCGFDLQAKAPLDSRQVVPEYDGLQALIDGNAAYEGMIVYDEGTKKTYQAQLVDGVLAFREFGINEAELKDLIASETTAAMEFKGAATALPENPSKGDFYKVATSFDVAEGETAKIGDSIVYDGEQWFIIPSGDDIEDTWRPVTGVDNDASLTFAAGDKLEKTVAADGTITYKHVAIDAPTATPVGEDEQTRTYIASIETDGHGHITGYKTATENVEDTNTTYEFEGFLVGEDEEAPSSVYFQVKSSEEEAAEVVYLDAYSKNEANEAFQPKGDYISDVALYQQGGGVLTDALWIMPAASSDGQKAFEIALKKKGITEEALADEAVTTAKIADGAVTDEKLSDALLDKINKNYVESETGKGLSTNDLTDELKGQYDEAYQHSQEDHAPADAQANVIESVKVNGTALTITNKAVDITVPTGALADKDEVAKTDLDQALATEIDSKVASVAAGDASVTVGGTATAPTVAVKISAAEGNALELANDGLKVIIPESTKVEASETNGNIKVDGQEVTVYSHPEKHAIADVDGLQDALDDLDALAITEFAKIGSDDNTIELTFEDWRSSEAEDYKGKILYQAKIIEGSITSAHLSTDLNKEIDDKADAADVYTKAEVEALFTWGSF